MLGRVRKLWSLFERRERWQLLGLFGLVLVGAALDVLGVGLIAPFLSLLQEPAAVREQPVLAGVYGALGEPPPRQFLMGTGVGLVGIYALKNAYLAGMYYLQFRFLFNKQYALASRLFRAYLQAPYPFHLQRNTAQLLRNVTAEVNQLFRQFLLPLVQAVTAAIVALGLAGLLLAVEPTIALVASAVLLMATLGFYRVVTPRMARLGKQRQYHQGQVVQHVNQGLGGIKEAKLLGREAFFGQQHDVHRKRFTRALQGLQTVNQLPRLYMETLAVGGIVAVVLALLARGETLGTLLPTLSLFAAAAFRLMPQFNKILNGANQMRFATHCVDVVAEEFAQTVPAATPARGVAAQGAVPQLQHAIELVGVTYYYPQSTEPALEDVSLRVPQGSSVGFVGSTGAGKTTLVDVLLGLLAPTQGQVLVDGVDIQQDLAGWQCQIGYIPQQIYLCDDTLRGNIAFGIPQAQVNEASVWQALRSAQLEALVAQLPAGLDTVVGERGVRLSGGQRQRVGIARALYHKPQVLVMDEATAALDNETEAGVMEAVEQLSGNKTLVIIAHRLSTVEKCDRLYLLEKGAIVDSGMYAQLGNNSTEFIFLTKF